MARKLPLRTAVIGCGFVGQIHAQAISQSPSATLVAVCDTDLHQANTLGNRYGARPFQTLDEMCAAGDLDVLTIATPDDQHVAPALTAIERGIHVFCEKPLAETLQQAQAICDAAKVAGVQFGVDYNRRFGFGYQQAKALLADDTALPVRQAVIQISDEIPSKVAHLPYALLTSLVSHHLDLIRWYGGEIRCVNAWLHGPTPKNPDQVTLVTESAGGMIATINALWRPAQQRTVEWTRLVSNDQVITIEDVQNRITVWKQSPDTIQQSTPSYFVAGNQFYDTVVAHLQAFLEAADSGQPPPVSAEDGCATLRIIEAAIESSLLNRPIDLISTANPKERQS